MSDEQQHSPGPWVLSDDGRVIIDANGYGVANCGQGFQGMIGAECAANARRIVACVNACAGVETEALERGRVLSVNPDALRSRRVRVALPDESNLLDDLEYNATVKQRDALLAALTKARLVVLDERKSLENEFETPGGEGYDDGGVYGAIKEMKELLAEIDSAIAAAGGAP